LTRTLVLVTAWASGAMPVELSLIVVNARLPAVMVVCSTQALVLATVLARTDTPVLIAVVATPHRVTLVRIQSRALAVDVPARTIMPEPIVWTVPLAEFATVVVPLTRTAAAVLAMLTTAPVPCARTVA